MQSRAEGGLDRIVADAFFQDADAGVFVDVGAAGPEFLSMSALFRDRGWRVIAVEPNPVFCEAQRAAGHEVLQCACADYEADAVDFQVVDQHGVPYEGGPVTFESFSSLAIKPGYLRAGLDIQTIKVDVRRLDTLLGEHAPDVDRVDVVSVDVEGWELEVLAGFSLQRYRPHVLIVENLLGDDAYPEALRERGYELWRRTAPNDVYCRSA